MKKSLKIMLCLAVIGLASCSAKFPPPDSQVTMATSAISQAESIGAYDAAPVELASAREKLNQARQAMRTGDNLLAQRWADQATADANLAQAKARTAKSLKSVAEFKEGLRILQEEVDRASAR